MSFGDIETYEVVFLTVESDDPGEYIIFGGYRGDNAIIGMHHGKGVENMLGWLKEIQLAGFDGPSQVTSIFIRENEDIFAVAIKTEIQNLDYLVIGKFTTYGKLLSSVAIQADVLAQTLQQVVLDNDLRVYLFIHDSANKYSKVITLNADMTAVSLVQTLDSTDVRKARTIIADQNSNKIFLTYKSYQASQNSNPYIIVHKIEGSFQDISKHPMNSKNSQDISKMTIALSANYDDFVLSCMNDPSINNRYNNIGYFFYDFSTNYFGGYAAYEASHGFDQPSQYEIYCLGIRIKDLTKTDIYYQVNGLPSDTTQYILHIPIDLTQTTNQNNGVVYDYKLSHTVNKWVIQDTITKIFINSATYDRQMDILKYAGY
eukprot:403359346